MHYFFKSVYWRIGEFVVSLFDVMNRLLVLELKQSVFRQISKKQCLSLDQGSCKYRELSWWSNSYNLLIRWFHEYFDTKNWTSFFTLTLQTNEFYQRFVVSILLKLSDELIKRLLSLNQISQFFLFLCPVKMSSRPQHFLVYYLAIREAVGCWICISWSKTLPSLVILMSPEPDTNIFIVPRGPRLDLRTSWMPLAAEILTARAWPARATSALGFSIEIAAIFANSQIDFSLK